MELKNKINVENELRDELKVTTMKLEYAMLQGNEIQTVVESMENEIKSNVVLIDQFKSELATKSDLLTKLENVNSELVLKCDKFNEILLNNTKDNEQYHLNIQNQLHLVSKEKLLIQNDLNLIIQQCLEISKQDESKKYLQDKVQLSVLNYHNLYTEFVNLSCDIESLLKCQTITVSNLREEILLKSAEIEHLQKQVLGSSLQQEYDRLEKEYMLRSCECDEAQEKILHLESILSKNEESKNVLKNDYESKCIEVEEYKKDIELLVSRNDSFHFRVNNFEDNVLVDLNEEFDLIKSELAKKTDHEKMLLEEKANLKCNFEELQEQLINVTKEMKLWEEKCEDSVTVINVLVNEIKDANSVKQNLESCLNEAEHELLKYEDLCENLKLELYSVQRELENACIKAESIEKQLQNLEFKFNDKINKKYFDGCDVRNQLIDPLVDFVHDIKLKLTELNSAMISGNQSEKSFRTKVVSGNDYILPHEETWTISSDSQPESPNGEMGLEIDNLLKILKEKNDLISTLYIGKKEMENNIRELRCQVKNQSDENTKHVNDIQFIANDLKEKLLLINNLNDELNYVQQLYTKLKEQNIKLSDKNEILMSNISLIENNLQDKTSLVCNLKNELNNLKIEHTKLKENNQANKKQIDFNYDIDLELRNGKKNIINEINLLEPGKITGVLIDHNLSNLLDTFVNLIMTKEHQIVTNLASNHSKIIQLYEDKIKQMQEDIKKGKEWQEQVESDNEKLVLELENLKSQISNFPCRELKIKTLTEKVLKAENLSFNYLSELEELKTQLSKTSEQNYQALSLEFEVFKTNSEQSIQDLKNKLENLTTQYNETLSMCEVQKSCRFSLEDQIGKIQSECACLKSVIEKKDEDIKNLLEGFKLKTNEYEIMIKNHSLQKEEMRIIHEKKISDLQFDLSNTKHKMYCTEKLLKEMNKNNGNDKVKLNMNDNSLIDVNNVTDKLRTILKCNGTLSEIYENICSLMTKCEYLEEEIKELKHANVNLDNECESMLDEVNNKSNKITELLTQVDVLNRNIEFLTEEREFLRNKCKQFKIFNNDLKKLNDEICSYEQNIYELRKDKGQLIVQHNKELKQLKNELQEVQAKNLELFNEYSALSETAINLEKSLKEDIQQLNRCIVDKNAKISTLELFSKSYSDDLKKKNHKLDIVFKRARDENHMLRSELQRLKKITNVCRSDQCTQTVEEQSLMSSTILTDQKHMLDKIAKFENDSKMMRMMLHHRKSKIEELEKQLNERHSKI
ncbi:unnamed protein product [Macrosiphum euphorbiae]|nr:unnamed protein product [Macrosiphum euphorbiae]